MQGAGEDLASFAMGGTAFDRSARRPGREMEIGGAEGERRLGQRRANAVNRAGMPPAVAG